MMHKLPNFSRSKENPTIKYGQLIKYNMRNIFLERSYTNCGKDASPKPFFIKNQNRAYFWINSLKFYNVCFYFMSNLRAIKI